MSGEVISVMDNYDIEWYRHESDKTDITEPIMWYLVYYILVPLSGFKYGKDRNAFRMRFSLGYFWEVMYINNKKLT